MSVTATSISLNGLIGIKPLKIPIVRFGTGSWDSFMIREPGQVIYDATTEQWILTYTGQTTSATGNIVVGAMLSDDGEQWTAHPDNPITGSTLAEDPYLAKNEDGTLYRDSSGRALMFCEERIDWATHRGVDLWRSGANVLTGWTRVGRVMDRGTAGAWDDEDVTSPVVIRTSGTNLVMLFEGRGTPDDGQIGVATSTDDGATWTKNGSNPIIAKGGGTWKNNALVPDDAIKVGSTWVLIVHGQAVSGAPWRPGRFSTTDAPGSWGASSFSELPGNPFAADSTNVVTCWGNDDHRAVWIHTAADGISFGALHPAVIHTA